MHFFKYVKQGAISVSATASEEPVLVTAFQDDKRKTLSIILINADTVNSKLVKLNFTQSSGLPSTYQMYLTTKETETTVGVANLCKDKGSIAPNATISIPARGVITLVGQNSQPEIILSTNYDEVGSQDLVVYPNPSNEGFVVSGITEAKGQIEISILDSQGREVKKQRFEKITVKKYISAMMV